MLLIFEYGIIITFVLCYILFYWLVRLWCHRYIFSNFSHLYFARSDFTACKDGNAGFAKPFVIMHELYGRMFQLFYLWLNVFICCLYFRSSSPLAVTFNKLFVTFSSQVSISIHTQLFWLFCCWCIVVIGVGCTAEMNRDRHLFNWRCVFKTICNLCTSCYHLHYCTEY